ncbi:hypothetical protein H0H92_005718 [Tricholoma furcatifolium]|nr:hypothetical protein H0H92_005718 [Tricholoma furcatifolium]
MSVWGRAGHPKLQRTFSQETIKPSRFPNTASTSPPPSQILRPLQSGAPLKHPAIATANPPSTSTSNSSTYPQYPPGLNVVNQCMDIAVTLEKISSAEHLKKLLAYRRLREKLEMAARCMAREDVDLASGSGSGSGYYNNASSNKPLLLRFFQVSDSEGPRYNFFGDTSEPYVALLALLVQRSNASESVVSAAKLDNAGAYRAIASELEDMMRQTYRKEYDLNRSR